MKTGSSISLAAVYFLLAASTSISHPIMVVMVILIASIYPWRVHAKYLRPQQVGLSEESIKTISCDESSALSWATYTRYKETPWSFILLESGRMDDVAQAIILIARRPAPLPFAAGPPCAPVAVVLRMKVFGSPVLPLTVEFVIPTMP